MAIRRLSLLVAGSGLGFRINPRSQVYLVLMYSSIGFTEFDQL